MIDLSSKPLPYFITFEGPEGCGKSTQIEKFYDWFIPNYGPAIFTREPGGTPLAEGIRRLLLDPQYNPSSRTELLLYGAARAQHLADKVRPQMQGGNTVICDRYEDSTKAYQGYARDIDLQIIDTLNNIAVEGLHPDLTFILDIDPIIGLNRAGVRGKKDRIEKEAIEFHQRVREGYLKIAEDNPNRCVVIPSQDGIELVQEDLRREFCKITGKPYAEKSPLELQASHKRQMTLL
jgi:dTMP kinase